MQIQSNLGLHDCHGIWTNVQAAWQAENMYRLLQTALPDGWERQKAEMSRLKRTADTVKIKSSRFSN